MSKLVPIRGPIEPAKTSQLALMKAEASVRESQTISQSSEAGPRGSLAENARRWGVILAGGDGTRLRGLTRIMSGDDRPKQFCRVVGQYTLLEQTRYRAARSIAPEQTIYALCDAHKRYFDRDLNQSSSRRLVQPCNRGTAPPILLSLLAIESVDRDAIVAVLPCDHYYSDEDAFTASLESAFAIATRQNESVILLGARPSGPEIEFGWIDIGSELEENTFHVEAFLEKPILRVARRLYRRGSLWNTFVMVGHVRAFLDLTWSAVPELKDIMRAASGKVLGNHDICVPDALYGAIGISDFSRHLLAQSTSHLLALRMSQMGWYDLGNPERVITFLRSSGNEIPAWVRAWGCAHGEAKSPLSDFELLPRRDQGVSA